MRNTILILMLCMAGITSHAQHLSIIDPLTSKVVNGDTIKLQSVENGFKGWQSLNIELQVKNTGNASIYTGARKIEFDAFTNASHSICFAGNCYDEKTFDSPTRDTIKPGETDKSFSGHLVYNDTIHKPGINLVAYQFYNVNDTSEYAMVYVQYNTHKTSGINDLAEWDKNIIVYPNPIIENIFIKGIEEKLNCTIYSSGGKIIKQFSNTTQINISGIPSGIYILEIKSSRGKTYRRIVK